METNFDKIYAYLIQFGVNLITAALIFIVGK